MLTQLPEVKVRLRIHEAALATAPTADEVRALLGVECSHFTFEKEVVRSERTRAGAEEARQAERLEDLVVAWLVSTAAQIGTEDYERLCVKTAHIEEACER